MSMMCPPAPPPPSAEVRVCEDRHNHDCSLVTALGKLAGVSPSDTGHIAIQKVYRWLQDPNRQKVTELDLRNTGLSCFPVELCMLTELRSLHLGRNYIAFVPREISKLTKLEFLSLSRNHISELPEELGLLPLKKLVLVQNGLKRLPESLGRSATLEDLDVCENNLTSIPKGLSHLKKINLRKNQISSLPQETWVALLANPTLEKVNLQDNPITSLPAGLSDEKGRVRFGTGKTGPSKHDPKPEDLKTPRNGLVHFAQ